MNDRPLEQTSQEDDLGYSLTYSIRKSDMFTNLGIVSANVTVNEFDANNSVQEEKSKVIELSNEVNP